MPAVNVKTVDSLQAYIAFVEKLRAYRRKRLWFRGCGKTSQDLKPSLYRRKRYRTTEARTTRAVIGSDTESLQSDLGSIWQRSGNRTDCLTKVRTISCVPVYRKARLPNVLRPRLSQTPHCRRRAFGRAMRVPLVILSIKRPRRGPRAWRPTQTIRAPAGPAKRKDRPLPCAPGGFGWC